MWGLDIKKRYTEEQTFKFLREDDAGITVKGLCRWHEISETNYYLWQDKFSGMDMSDAKRLIAREVEYTTTTSQLNAPTIQQRQIQSVVAINSGDTIVLGGLIQDAQTEGGDGIPGLSRIPIIGNLFKQVRNDKRRTELLVLITPRVVRNQDEANEITNEFRRKLRGIRPIPTT